MTGLPRSQLGTRTRGTVPIHMRLGQWCVGPMRQVPALAMGEGCIIWKENTVKLPLEPFAAKYLVTLPRSALPKSQETWKRCGR